MKNIVSVAGSFDAIASARLSNGDRQRDAPTLADALAQGLKHARAVPTVRRSARQAALDKAAWLKQRLEMLKSLLLFASPRMAKAIALQLKSIAHQLASLGQSAGGGGSETAASTSSPAATEAADTNGIRSDGAVAVQMPAVEDTSERIDEGAGALSPAGNSDEVDDSTGDGVASDDAAALPGTAGDDADAALRQTIEEAKKLLKQLIERVRAKLRADDANARRALQAAEQSLARLEPMAKPSAVAGLYTAQGGMDAALAGVAVSITSAAGGTGVDIHV